MNTAIIKTGAKTITKFVSRNSSAILTGMAVAGVGTTTFLAIRATGPALERIRNENAETPLEKVRAAWIFYIPTFVSALITIACIIGADRINSKRAAALAGLYSISEKALKDYQDSVVEEFGEKKAEQIKDAIAKKEVDNTPINDSTIVFTGKGDVLCLDSLSGRYFMSKIEDIRAAVNDMNKLIIDQVWITLNDFYYELGLEATGLGSSVGWDLEHMIDIDFSSQITADGTPCLVLVYRQMPRAEWMYNIPE